MPIKAVSFDVWGTLLNIDVIFEAIVEKLSRELNVGDDVVRKAIVFSYDYAKSLRRFSDIDGFEIVVESQRFLANKLGVDVDTVVKAIDDVFNTVSRKDLLYKDVLTCLEILHRLGFSVGIIGNTVFWSSRYTRGLLRDLEVEKYIAVQVYSDELRIQKPNRGIFHEFCRKLSVKPYEVVHVGDSVIEDIGGALAAGMKAIYIDRQGLDLGDKVYTVIKGLGLGIVKSLDYVINIIELLT